MKHVLLTLIATWLIGIAGSAQTPVSGTIINETWTISGSPYHLVGDVSVAALTIESGVHVVAQGNYEFAVPGILTAEGNGCDSIYFDRADTTSTWRGILFENSLPGSELAYCSITRSGTSGVRIINSIPVLSHCGIHHNSSRESGGGLNILLGQVDTLSVQFCAISYNSAQSNHTQPTNNGGGVSIDADTGLVRLVGCSVNNNLTYRSDGHVYGGGVCALGYVSLSGCTISNNIVQGQDGIPGGSSAGRGGGIYFELGRLRIENTVLHNNAAYGYAQGGMSGNQGYASGAGLHAESGEVVISNSIFDNNNASSSHGTMGGGIAVITGVVSITNSTLAYNSPHAIQNTSVPIPLLSSIVYFNNNDADQFSGDIYVTYSDVMGGYNGTGNINYNPIFNSPEDLRIVPPSACIDAGSPVLDLNDLCFGPSLGTVTNDMGAHGGPLACSWPSASLSATFIIAPASSSAASDGVIDASITGGDPPYTILWTGPDGFSSSDEDLDGLFAGWYYITVYDDPCGEVLSDSVLVDFSDFVLSDSPHIRAMTPNPFTEHLIIASPASKGMRIGVTDQLGNAIRTFSSASGNLAIWDGRTTSGTEAPPGMYLVTVIADGQRYTQRVVKQ